MKKETVDKIFSVFSEQTPEPKTELNYVNNYTLLVAVVLSAQATDVGVNKATESLFKAVQTPEDMVDLGEEGLKKYIKTIGLFNSKAKNVMALSNMLIEKHNSQVPDDFDSLKALPGVGVKTADVVLNCAFGKPTIAVDTHVFRVSNRLGLVKTKTPDTTGAKLLKVIPSKWLQHAHHWLILHGRYICEARKPLCHRCDIINFCEYKDKNLGSK
ncbi:MAG: endonuclease III [Rickettsiales bacterium]|nr:endonuclease III [Pseudomonadota bacterium]MDA0967583.1 endonuclease III [Pseudomonadota bacterium]MDG4544388.1 endonuclease III [Rickettsiales bacterium]MDG4546518.1 endonuclease III [Rickettsiales bacterium]MDG4548646.1 endonuclease III [Rickettsiales bacterium]